MAKILLESKSSDERHQAAFALMKMAPASRAAVTALAHALDDDSLIVRHNAAQALVRLGTEARPAVPALLKALTDKNNQTNLETFSYTIQDEVALALGKASAGSADAVPALMEALQAILDDKNFDEIKTVNLGGRSMAKDSPKMTGGKKAAEQLIHSKEAFAQAFGEIGPSAQPAVPMLRDMIEKDKISDFHFYAEEALQKIEGKSSGSR
jgi:hypothetical protein